LLLAQKLQHRIHIEDDEEAAVDLVHALRQIGPAAVEMHGIRLEVRGIKPEHLANIINKKSESFTLMLNADGHPALNASGLVETKTPAQGNGSNHPTAEVQEPGDLGRGERHGSDVIDEVDVMDAADRQPKQLTGDQNSHILDAAHGGPNVPERGYSGSGHDYAA
jgi:hypothetical protein